MLEEQEARLAALGWRSRMHSQKDLEIVTSSNLTVDLAMENLTGASLNQTITGPLKTPPKSIRNENLSVYLPLQENSCTSQQSNR